MNPFVVVGGFIPENQEGGFPENPGTTILIIINKYIS